MLNKSTVFVLGAGASVPYGFPTGAQLRQELCGLNSQSALAEELRTHCGIGLQQIESFANAFLRSGLSSIDAFLSRRSDLIEVGRLAIALILSKKERPDQIFRAVNDDDWYGLLWNKLVDNVSKPDELNFDGIKIVTFNYDRSFQYYLMESIRYTFGVSEATAFALLLKIPLIHVYGSLGNLLYSEQTNQRPFPPAINGRFLKSAADNIRIIPEAREDDVGFQQVRSWFRTAHQICFLGFGFDPLNMKRLGLGDVLSDLKSSGKDRPHVFATVHGKTESEIGTISSTIGHPKITTFLRHQNVMALRDSPILA